MLTHQLSNQTLSTPSTSNRMAPSPTPQPPTFSPATILLLLSSLPLATAAAAVAGITTCRSYCGNITVDYPFGIPAGCGHPFFRQLLFCINGVLLLHIPSGSYRVLAVDYAFRRLTLHDAAMSDCYSLSPSPSGGGGFAAEPWRAKFLFPAADNVFFLLGCRRDSPLFQLGFPVGNGVCRSVSGMSCRDYYRCPAWDAADSMKTWPDSSPECCSVPAGALPELNLTRLRCAAYSSAYSLAPVRFPGAGAWSYGIRTEYSVPAGDEEGCRECQFSGGACGYDAAKMAVDGGGGLGHICFCGGGDGGIDAWNSTSTCDSTDRSSGQAPVIKEASIFISILGGWLVYVSTWILEF